MEVIDSEIDCHPIVVGSSDKRKGGGGVKKRGNNSPMNGAAIRVDDIVTTDVGLKGDAAFAAAHFEPQTGVERNFVAHGLQVKRRH
jgi:hypothetical protein